MVSVPTSPGVQVAKPRSVAEGQGMTGLSARLQRTDAKSCTAARLQKMLRQQACNGVQRVFRLGGWARWMVPPQCCCCAGKAAG